MDNQRTIYTNRHREKLRRSNRILNELRDLALDYPELGPLIRRAEFTVDEKWPAGGDK